MTVMLLCGAGLLVRTVIALNGANNGFDKQDVLTMEVALPGARYTPERRVRSIARRWRRCEALPGVESAAAGNSLAVIGPPRGGTLVPSSRHAGPADERKSHRRHPRRDARLLPHAAHPHPARARVHAPPTTRRPRRDSSSTTRS